MNPRLLIPVVLLVAAGCRSDGHVSVLGYSSGGLFDPTIKTVYVPVFTNVALQTQPNRGLEVDITQAVVKEINTRTPMRVVNRREEADTELVGTLTNIQKVLLNRNLENLTREAEITLTVSVVWTDLRDGRILSNQRSPVGNVEPAPQPFDPSAPPPPPVRIREAPIPQMVIATGRVLPELGETNATGNQMAVNAMARQIVNMMEAPW